MASGIKQYYVHSSRSCAEGIKEFYIPAALARTEARLSGSHWAWAAVLLCTNISRRVDLQSGAPSDVTSWFSTPPWRSVVRITFKKKIVDPVDPGGFTLVPGRAPPKHHRTLWPLWFHRVLHLARQHRGKATNSFRRDFGKRQRLRASKRTMSSGRRDKKGRGGPWHHGKIVKNQLKR